MPKIFTSEKQKIGETGENIAVKYLIKNGFLVLERNYTKKWGELDIVAEKENKIHFFEVKSVSCLPQKFDSTNVKALANEYSDHYRPEENMHPWKIKKLSRTIQTYLLSKKIPERKEWQLDLIIVYLDLQNKKAKIKIIDNLVI